MKNNIERECDYCGKWFDGDKKILYNGNVFCCKRCQEVFYQHEKSHY